MDKDRLNRRLLEVFCAELGDHVQSLERTLLMLEKSDDRRVRDELLRTMLRTAHTLKGAAGSVKAEAILSLAHRLEEFFAAAGHGTIPVDASFFNIVLPSLDAIADAGRRLKDGTSLEGAPIHGILQQLSGVALKSSDPVPYKFISDPSVPSTLPTSPTPTDGKEDPVPMGVQRTTTIRIAADKLDELVARSGELLGVRHRFDERYDRITELHDVAAEIGKSWRVAEKTLAMMLKAGSQMAADNRASDEVQPASRPKRELMRLVTRHRELVSHLEHGMQTLVTDVDADRRALLQSAVPLDADIRRARMVPFVEACDGLERIVRDLTADGEKRATLEIHGGDIEIDRSVLEGLKDALLHLTRNAIDHGVEPRALRKKEGKPEVGHISIVASLRGPRIEVVIADDGPGLDIGAIRNRALANGLSLSDDPQELIKHIFRAGFSTARAVTHISGRGVGLDIVMSRLSALRGTVDVRTDAGRGTRFTLTLPLTLTTVRAVLVRVGAHVFAVDTTNVRSALRIGLERVKSIEGQDVTMIDDHPIPLIALAELLEMPGTLAQDGPIPAIVLESNGRAVACLVNELLAEREVVVLSLGPRLRRVPCTVGGTLLPDGRIAVILDPTELVVRASTKMGTAASVRPRLSEPAIVRKRVLVADDSLTVRTLEKSILEAAGYDVIVAADGAEAWQLLLDQGADLVVSDVDMPHMDGFALTEAIRSSNRFRTLPVILVTGQENDADRARGLAVGADAYLLKSAFDQKELLATIEEIL